MKEDLGPAPEQVPKKRRQLEAAPDLWLAQWLDRGNLTPSERRRLGEEKHRRRTAAPDIIVGVTATREGLTPMQKRVLTVELEGLRATEAHHGDCVGGDATFHSICRKLRVPIVLHPPENGKWRAWSTGAIREERARPFLERNQEIVKAATHMYGLPKETSEPPPARGQGTWSTIRYARKREVKLKIIWPNGEIT